MVIFNSYVKLPEGIISKDNVWNHQAVLDLKTRAAHALSTHVTTVIGHVIISSPTSGKSKKLNV